MGGWYRTIFTTNPTNHMPTHSTHWKKKPTEFERGWERELEWLEKKRKGSSEPRLPSPVSKPRLPSPPTISSVELFDGYEIATEEHYGDSCPEVALPRLAARAADLPAMVIISRSTRCLGSFYREKHNKYYGQICVRFLIVSQEGHLRLLYSTFHLVQHSGCRWQRHFLSSTG